MTNTCAFFSAKMTVTKPFSSSSVCTQTANLALGLLKQTACDMCRTDRSMEQISYNSE